MFFFKENPQNYLFLKKKTAQVTRQMESLWHNFSFVAVVHVASKLAAKWKHGAQTQSTTCFTKVACLEHRRALVSVSSVKMTNKPPDLFVKKVNLVNLLKKKKS